jgi:oxygen-dependent protoporphyrinogen oxidase
MRAVIVGGGIAGLAAANRLLERAEAARAELDLTLVEAEARPGGAIGTTRAETPEGPLLVEWGADAFITEKPWALALAKRLGLEARLIGTRDAPGVRRALVARGGRLHAVPEGFLLLGPSRLLPFFRSPLLTPSGKLRAALDLALPPRGPDAPEESVGAFVRRRLGRECWERLAQPLVRAIHGGDPDRLSLRAAFPPFERMEREHGSVIRGLRAQEERGAGARYGLFASFGDGMQVLVDALAARIGAGRLRLGAPAKSIRSRQAGRWEILLGTGETLEADAVIVALPAPRAAELLREADAALASRIAGIRAASSAIVTLAWRRADVSHPLDAFGLVVPRSEGMRIMAASFSSVKFERRAPEGVALVRAFLESEGETEAALIAWARDDLGRLLGTRAAPFFERVQRHTRAMPQLEVGHLDRIAAIRTAAAAHPGLAIAGNYFGGVGIPDSVRSGEEAADALWDAHAARETPG